MEYTISVVTKHDYRELTKVWEESVRATHDFLPEEEIQYLKPLVFEKYLDAVTLACIRDKQKNIIGFSGVDSNKIEMLFVSPREQGKGVGSALCRYALNQQKCTKVDVNEQNPKAIVFYEKMNFTVKSRSPLDGQGKPYPILHMELNVD